MGAEHRLFFASGSEVDVQADFHAIESLRQLKKLGHITPSLNPTLETLNALMSYPLSDRVSNHYTRIHVTQAARESGPTGQFATGHMVAAAKLLNDARMDAMVWNGTSGHWNGPQADREICRAVTEATGVPISTSTLAQLELLEHFDIERLGLVVPFADGVTEKIVATYARAGHEVVGRANGVEGPGVNFEDQPLETWKRMLRQADSPRAQCLVIVCTNVPAALVVEEMEAELGKPIFDSVIITLYKGLDLVGIRPEIAGWGALMAGTLDRQGAAT